MASTKKTNEKATNGKSAGTEPSLRQRDILDAYLVKPNARAVAKELHTNERHVRRLVKDYTPYLEERRNMRDAEHLEKELARQARTQAWIDDTHEADLARLDELTRSVNEGIALRAIKAKLELSATVSIRPMATEPSSVDTSLADIEAALEQDLRKLLAGEGGLDG